MSLKFILILGSFEMPDHERRLLLQEMEENPFVELQKEFSSYY
jgi:hypothetical protein